MTTTNGLPPFGDEGRTTTESANTIEIEAVNAGLERLPPGQLRETWTHGPTRRELSHTVVGPDGSPMFSQTLEGITRHGRDASHDEKAERADSAAQSDDLDNVARIESTKSIVGTLSLPREILFVAVICFGQLFTQAGLGQAISIIHIIGASFGITNPGELSWFMAGYSLTVGTFILFSGRLGDTFGHKTLFLVGMAWFSVWSMVCGLAIYSNHVLFVVARAFQGIGPAIVLPNGLAILGVAYPPGRRKEMVFAVFGAMAPSGAILGSLFASLLALTWWPWAFWVFALVLAASLVVGHFAIPDASNGYHVRPQGLKDIARELDLVGTILGVCGLVLVNFAWNQAPIVGWPEPYVYVTLILGLLLLIAFLAFELKFAESPLIPFHALSSDVSFVLGAVACGWACFGIWFFYIWQFLLVLQGRSPLLATAMMSPVTISGFCAAIFTGYMLHRLRPPIVMTLSLLAFTAGVTVVATCPVDQTYWGQIFVSTVVMTWGMDMSFPAATLILSDAVPRRHQGIAASLVNTVVNYSISLGLGFAGTIETHVNNGGENPVDILKGYRGSFYMGVGLSGLGVVVCLAFLVKTTTQKPAAVREGG
ncbi:MFS general substrate transporter [Durotheca rogersii]|uniref:MFS general substrate transporter n=1 Tax=Durotheca rogersii TaxID=419775 RepID=UPI002220DF58|nr:MFS general substrate transporter [Durotheca rogersii]KAI5860570.1 MFS general substrate transporter [Durotheca rogersii]